MQPRAYRQSRPAAVAVAVAVAATVGCGGGGAKPTPDLVRATDMTGDLEAAAPDMQTVKGPLPAGFLFGAAIDSYQGEGNYRPDGLTAQSNWSEWEALGKVMGMQTNPQGSGFYLKYESDLDAAKAAGLTAFRFSMDWARIEPVQGQYDQAAMDHYIAIIDAIRARGMTPLVTLFHWVVPTYVQSPKMGTDLFSV